MEDKTTCDISPNEDSSFEFLKSFSIPDSSSIHEGPFYFETDYLPLKGNPDYLKLLKTLSILELQRIKTCQNIDMLEAMKDRVKKDPVNLLKDILGGTSDYSGRCKIERAPDIDWSKFKNANFSGPPNILTTRQKIKQENVDPFSNTEPAVVTVDENNKIRVRGRVYNDSKPETFNQLWTVEEQLRLEALLVQFPPEPVEQRRWKKIAEALGNRTAQQVCSRVQKYFRKLRKAGIAVPSYAPRSKFKPAWVHRKNKHLLYKPTTFFPGASIKQEESADSGEESGVSAEPDLSHWVDIINTIKQEKSRQAVVPVMHYGYKCVGCGECPIIGLRWECKTCSNVSLCCDCTAAIIDAPSPVHPPHHLLTPFHHYSNAHYSHQAFNSNNYLDPNFA